MSKFDQYAGRVAQKLATYGDPVRVLREQGTATDFYGNPVESFGLVTETVGVLYYASRSEYPESRVTSGGLYSIDEPRCAVPDSTDVEEGDRVEVRGGTYKVLSFAAFPTLTVLHLRQVTDHA